VSEHDAKNSDLVEIAKRNGDFRKNYGPIIGAILYWLSIGATRPRLPWWNALIIALLTVVAGLLEKHGWPSLPRLKSSNVATRDYTKVRFGNPSDSDLHGCWKASCCTANQLSPRATNEAARLRMG
jgi:hypothetical protein